MKCNQGWKVSKVYDSKKKKKEEERQKVHTEEDGEGGIEEPNCHSFVNSLDLKIS